VPDVLLLQSETMSKPRGPGSHEPGGTAKNGRQVARWINARSSSRPPGATPMRHQPRFAHGHRRYLGTALRTSPGDYRLPHSGHEAPAGNPARE
jgi:hypothetical protein